MSVAIKFEFGGYYDMSFRGLLLFKSVSNIVLVETSRTPYENSREGGYSSNARRAREAHEFGLSRHFSCV